MKSKSTNMGLAVALGAGTGAAIGAATGHMAGWVAIGVAAGAVIAAVTRNNPAAGCCTEEPDTHKTNLPGGSQ